MSKSRLSACVALCIFCIAVMSSSKTLTQIFQHIIITTLLYALCTYNNYYVYLYNIMCRPFATRSEDHDHHMTVFPSLKPAGRHEVIALKVPTCTSNPAWQPHKYTIVT